MRVLVGIACVCIIGATIIVFGGDYMEYRKNKRMAFEASCESIVNSDKSEINNLPPEKVRSLLRHTEDCRAYLISGNLPD